MSRNVPRKSRGLGGYTVVEVLMALAVLAVGGAGVIAMQRATLLGNLRARNLATANAIAASWAERLHADAIGWTDPAGVSNLASTNWIKLVGTDFNLGLWTRPAEVLGASPTANVQGQDTPLDGTGDPPAFCTQMRLSRLTTNTIRAEIRVFWLRNQGGGNVGTDFCPLNDSGVGQARDRYHFVYLTTAVMRNDTMR